MANSREFLPRRLPRILATAGLSAVLTTTALGMPASAASAPTTSSTTTQIAPRPGAQAVAVTCEETSLPVSTVLDGPQDGTVFGTLCKPEGAQPTTVQLLAHGFTYNRNYWDWQQQPEQYSYARRAAADGYATFAVDRLGSGKSTKPPGVTHTVANAASAMNDVVGHLRAGRVGGQSYNKVLWFGHSMGTMLAYEYANHPEFQPVDGFAMTGLLHRMKASWMSEAFLTQMEPTSPAGYWTTKPGVRKDMFYNDNVDPAVIAYDEQTKDMGAMTELQTANVNANVPPPLNSTAKIRVPVLALIGGQDGLLCRNPGDIDGVTCTDQEVDRVERPYFQNSPDFRAKVIPNTGHDLNLHLSADQSFDALLDWSHSVAGPQG